MDCSGSGHGQVEGSPEGHYEHSGSIKCGECLDWVRTGQLLKKDCAASSELVMWKSHLHPLHSHL